MTGGEGGEGIVLEKGASCVMIVLLICELRSSSEFVVNKNFYSSSFFFFDIFVSYLIGIVLDSMTGWDDGGVRGDFCCVKFCFFTFLGAFFSVLI